MDFILERVERWLWPNRASDHDIPPRHLLAARYAFAVTRDLLTGELNLRAMSLVYTTMLAIVPLLAFSFSIMKGLGLHRELQPMLLRFLTPLGPRAGELTDKVVGFVDNVSGSTLASVSVVLLLYSALSMAQKVEGSFNFVWRVDRPRNLIRRLSEYLSVMLLGPLAMSVAMGFTATLASTTAMTWLQQYQPIGHWIASMSELTPYLLVIAAFTFLYIFVPNTHVLFKPAAFGGLFAGIAWAASGSLFTSFVVSTSRTEAIYSGFAIVIVAMIWLYLSWLILLLGAQLAFYLQNPDYLRLGQRTETMSNGMRERLALSAMLLVGRDFDQPGHGWRVESLAARIRVPRHLLDPVVGSLTAAELLTETTERRLLPAKDPRRIEVAEILDAVRNAARDGLHASGGDWNDTVRALTSTIDQAIDACLAGKSLADLVDADLRAETATATFVAATTEVPAAHGATRAVSLVPPPRAAATDRRE